MIYIVKDTELTMKNLNLLYGLYHSEMIKIFKKYNMNLDAAIFHKYGERYEDIVISFPNRNDDSGVVKYDHPVTVKVIMTINVNGSESKLYYINYDGYNSHVVFGNGIFEHVYIIASTEFNEHKLIDCLLMSKIFSELDNVKKDIIQNKIKFTTEQIKKIKEEIKRKNEEMEILNKNLSINNSMLNDDTINRKESTNSLNLEKTQIIENKSKSELLRRSSRNRNKYTKL